MAAAHGPRGFAMIDVSDGLWNECHLLAEASGLVIELDLDAVPLHPAATAFAEATGADRDALRLFSGEEYELLFSSGLRSDQLPEGTRRIGSFLERGASSSAVVALRERRRVDVADATFSHYQP